MAARLTQKVVNDELTRLGRRARLEKATGYFYFFGGSQGRSTRVTPSARVYECSRSGQAPKTFLMSPTFF